MDSKRWRFMKPDLPSGTTPKPNEFADLLQRAQARLPAAEADSYLESRPDIARLNRVIETYHQALILQRDYLNQNDMLWKLALQASGDGVWDWDILSGHVSYASLWKEANGLTQEEIGSHYDDWIARVHPEDLEDTLARIEEHLEGRTATFICSQRLLRRDGGYQWVLARGMVVSRDSDNKALRMVGIHTDITPYKKAEQQLMTSTRMLEASQAIAHVGSVEMDIASRSIFWSAETYRIHDTSPEEYTPALDPNFESYPPESRAIIQPALMGAIKDGTVFDVEVEKYTMKGRKINLRTTCIAEMENGKPVRLTGIYQDITEQKAREKVLKEKEQMLSESQRIAEIGSWSWDLTTNEMRWSDQTYELFGVSPNSFPLNAQAFFDLLPFEERKRMKDWCLGCICGQPQGQLEFKVQLPDGSQRVINGLGYLERDNEGKPQRMVGTVQNVTHQRQVELRQQHHNQILAMLAQKAPLEQVLDKMARDVETLNPGMLCSILLLDEEGTHLSHGAAPSLPPFYVAAVNGETIGFGKGACGTAAFTGERAVTEDISNHPWWANYRTIARNAGLASCWSQPILAAGGKVLGAFAIYHRYPCTPKADDLQLIEQEARLAALAIEKTLDGKRVDLAASVFTHSREGIMITDGKGLIVEINEAFTSMTGYNRAEAIGQHPNLLRSHHHTPEFFATLWQELETNGHWSGEIWNRHKDGHVLAFMETISAVYDAAGNTSNYVSLFTDITPLKEHQRQLEHIAHYDALTGLPNRVLLADRLQQAIAHSNRASNSLAVLYLDLDGFKAVNDSHGHNVGDELLVILAERLKSALREGDTLARIGGDEFVVVLVDLNLVEDYEPVLQRLLAAAAEPIQVNGLPLQVSASIGVTLYPQDGADPDQLMRHADQAMYLAKQAGKNCYHLFDVARDVAVKTQRETIEHIRRAIDNNEFVLHYQPQVNMRTGAVIGVEALIRWQHPQRGLLSPGNFLPIIEDHSLSLELGDWVIDRALNQLGQWHNQGLTLEMSVNVSAHQLQRKNFAMHLAELLALHPQVPPNRLSLEIVETSALDDLAKMAQLIRDCKELGVEFAVDDFGTGYSSLTYLRHLPARQLKIDQSFVRDMLEDPDDLAIVRGVIGLAAAFHREVIAEGVESVAHGQLLIAQGCQLAQGYGIARPMPAADIPAWVSSWRPDKNWMEVSRV
jgi:diguanylate cyclase (GGDEF)-like protein/PAS domain S-box-containing protein